MVGGTNELGIHMCGMTIFTGKVTTSKKKKTLESFANLVCNR